MNVTPEPSPPPSSRGGVALWLAAGLVFLGVNLATSARSPVVWQDEVMFADPAVNLATGRGFTTSAWFQPRETPFAGNSPLHSLCLAPWVKVFGVNAVAVRSLNYVLVLAAVGVLTLALARLGLVNRAADRFALAALVLCADGVTYSYRGGRYDCLGMLVVAAMLLAVTIPAPRARAAALVALAALVPWAGLQLVPYTALLGLLLLLVRGRSAVGDVAAVAVGGAVGTAALVGVFRAEGVWPEFVKSVTLLGGAKRTLAARAADALRAPATEPSSLLLLAALAVLLAFELRRRGARPRAAVVVGLLAGVVVPCALAFAGKYVRYYAWMSSIPMAVCVVACLGEATAAARLAVAPLLLLAGAVGLPARLAVTGLEWRLRDPAPVDRLVSGQVGPGDWVFTEYEAYYPAKRSAAVVLLPPYIGDASGPVLADPPITPAERDRVTVLITKPDTAAQRFAFFGGGGRWAAVARYAADPAGRVRLLARVGFGSKPYDLTVYRRRGG